MTDALKVSCDAYFYQYGNAAGIDSIDVTGALLGLGQESGVASDRRTSRCHAGPGMDGDSHPHEKWSSAYTANVSIGQGYVLASPLQMAMAYATVANGGISYYPRLVEKVLNQDGTPALDEDGQAAFPEKPKVRADLRNDFTPEQIELVRHGFWEVVNEDGGTGGGARMEDVEVAGKTGTAEAKSNGKDENVAWFCCFAPYDHPKYVIAVMVQGASGHGGFDRRPNRRSHPPAHSRDGRRKISTAARLGRAGAQG